MTAADPSRAWPARSEMAARIRAFDWAGTPLGAISGWPRSLQTMVGVVLRSPHQMAIYWGADLLCLYNDAESRVLGDLHPGALGVPAAELLRDSWDVVGPQLRNVMSRGEAVFAEDAPLTFNRWGRPELGWFTYSYSAIPDDHGGAGGVLLVTEETTARVLGARRLAVLRRVPECGLQARDAQEAAAVTVAALVSPDTPGAAYYALDDSGRPAARVAAAGPGAWTDALPAELALDGDDALAAACRELVAGPAPSSVLSGERLGPTYLSRIRHREGGAVRGILLVRTSDALALDDDYRGFLEMIGTGMQRNVALAWGREQEWERSRAIAALSRAQSTLFSNTSHELRTPLTLILGQLEQLDGEGSLPEAAHDEVRVARRSAMRMLKLVDGLLDLSRLEAGEQIGHPRPVDLPALTCDLAAMFRSTAERSGLELTVDCPPLDRCVLADADAWERIVSNLLSNAIKFTRRGGIAVRTRVDGNELVLVVEDTGVGIAAEEVPRIFGRFYRGAQADARSHEGSGVGLALVSELLARDGGSIAVSRRRGRGTRMTVRVPLRWAAGETRRDGDGTADGDVGRLAALSVAEAEGWLDRAPDGTARRRPDRVPRAQGGPHVLVAEDNADMRGYLARLLRDRFSVELARDGAEACRLALGAPPDVVVADVMMPGLDGFTLLRRLRDDPRTHELPVILLSARADPDSTATALELGADDYIVKPFNARELIARVDATLANSRARAGAAEERGRAGALRGRDSELRVLLNDLRAAQRRVTVAVDQERRRIERDLHDGAQQRLVSIRLELGLVKELLDEDPQAAGARLDALRAALDEAVEELRDLAQGVYPPLLASDGLGAAVLAVARRLPIPVAVRAARVDHAPPSVESAAYFCCLEALQNVIKHAGPGARAEVTVTSRRGVLEFHVRDDGAGFDTRFAAGGHGLINMRDRLDALGGSLEITSAPGHGTELAGRIPLP